MSHQPGLLENSATRAGRFCFFSECRRSNLADAAFSSQSRNRALSHTVAAREFGKRGTFRPSVTGLGLLFVCQFRFPAHALPALLGPAAALGGAGADKIALHV